MSFLLPIPPLSIPAPNTTKKGAAKDLCATADQLRQLVFVCGVSMWDSSLLLRRSLKTTTVEPHLPIQQQ